MVFVVVGRDLMPRFLKLIDGLEGQNKRAFDAQLHVKEVPQYQWVFDQGLTKRLPDKCVGVRLQEGFARNSESGHRVREAGDHEVLESKVDPLCDFPYGGSFRISELDFAGRNADGAALVLQTPHQKVPLARGLQPWNEEKAEALRALRSPCWPRSDQSKIGESGVAREILGVSVKMPLSPSLVGFDQVRTEVAPSLQLREPGRAVADGVCLSNQ